MAKSLPGKNFSPWNFTQKAYKRLQNGFHKRSVYTKRNLEMRTFQMTVWYIYISNEFKKNQIVQKRFLCLFFFTQHDFDLWKANFICSFIFDRQKLVRNLFRQQLHLAILNLPTGNFRCWVKCSTFILLSNLCVTHKLYGGKDRHIWGTVACFVQVYLKN